MTDRARILAIHQSDPDCLARYKSERIDGIESTNEAARVGTAVHRAAEALAYVADDELTREEQFHVARQAIDAAAAELPLSPVGAADALAIMEGALSPTSRLHFGRPTGWEHSAETRWALDRHFKPCDPDDPKRLAGGTIDLVEWDEAGGTVRVTDEKTTKHWQSGDDLYHEWQPRLYCLWALANFGVRKVTFRYRNLRHGYAVSAECRAGEAWIEATKARVLSLRAEREVALEMDVWPETMGDSCAYCPIRHRCGSLARAAREGRIPDAALTPAEKARRLLALRSIEADYERDLRAVLAAGAEPIDLGHGVAFGLKPVTKWRLVAAYADDEGAIRPEQREALLARLRVLGMTPAQEAAWFLFCREGDVPAAVKRAVQELLGRAAGRFLEDASVSPIEPMTRWEMSAWMPTTGKKAGGGDWENELDAAFA